MAIERLTYKVITITKGDIHIEISDSIDHAALMNIMRTLLCYISKAEHIYIATGYTNMRKSIDGLAALVQQNINLDPFSNSRICFVVEVHQK